MARAENVGMFDRIVRAALGTALVFYGVLYLVEAASIVSVIIGLVLILTALTASCPLYSFLGISTHRRPRVEERRPAMPEVAPPVEMEMSPPMEKPKPKKKARKRRRRKKSK